jgi:hypothetical protein
MDEDFGNLFCCAGDLLSRKEVNSRSPAPQQHILMDYETRGGARDDSVKKNCSGVRLRNFASLRN